MQRKIISSKIPESIKVGILSDLEKANKKIKKLTSDRDRFYKYWQEDSAAMRQHKKDAELYKQEYYRVLIGQNKIETERLKKETEKWKSKLDFHDLYNKGIIKTPCANCQLNGNCQLQDIYRGKVVKEYRYGAVPMSQEDTEKILEFKIDLVDQWANENLLN